MSRHLRNRLLSACCLLVLILLSRPGAAQTITEGDVLAMAGRAVSVLEEQGDAGLAVIGEPNGAFHQGELYAFVYDPDVNIVAHPFKPTLVGKNYKGKPDVKGFNFRDEIVAKGLAGGGWTEYYYQKPEEAGIHKKRVYSVVAEHGGNRYIVAVGMY